MADFCKNCHIRIFGKDCKCDTEGLCKEGEITNILCEGHGQNIWIDHTGKIVEQDK